MAKYIIDGGTRLRGTTYINGSKNAALPMLAASILTDEPVALHNVPMIRDVMILLDILRHLGTTVEIDDHTVRLQTKTVATTRLPDELASKLRASILLIGPLLARAGQVILRHPGGCILGRRPVGSHFDALQALGATFQQDDSHYYGKAVQLIGARMFLDEVSVTATENALMAAVLTHGTTIIEPAACEPHIVSLGRMLEQMGADIEGLGTHTITVRGVEALRGTEATVNSDEIETGTLAIAIGLTHGSGTLMNVPTDSLTSIRHKLSQMGIVTELSGTSLKVGVRDRFSPARIQIDTWPRLPTDLQPQLTVLATQADGQSLVHDWMYDRRLLYIDELVRMGANVLLCDPHRALVSGPTPLRGRTIPSPDLRAGMAFVLAGLIAEGQTTVEHVEMIERGYEKIDERLRSLGARIIRVEES